MKRNERDYASEISHANIESAVANNAKIPTVHMLDVSLGSHRN